MADYIDRAAELVSDDEEFDSDDQPRPRKSNGATRNDAADSSEEESEDEEAERAVREGFIVDELDDDDDEEGAAARKRRKHKRVREEEFLDADDLEIIGEVDETDTQPKFKRLKQGHRADASRIFADDEELEDDPGYGRDDLADFIEEDVFSDDERERLQDAREVGKPGTNMAFNMSALTEGLDEAAMEDYRAAFGTGDEYEWALSMQEAAEDDQEEHKAVDLKDVFEPGQLQDRLLTDEDMEIRAIDIPERLQLARKNLVKFELDPEQEEDRLREEVQWILSLIGPKKQFKNDPKRTALFEEAVAAVVRFMTKDNLEVPFIFQHRRDYIVEEVPIPEREGRDKGDTKIFTLVTQTDLWEISDLDLRFQSLMEKRHYVEVAYKKIRDNAAVEDEVLDDMIPKVASAEDVQDLQDYLYFRYSAELQDIQSMTAEINGTHKRPRARGSIWEKTRSSKIYQFVRAIGMTADNFARNALGQGSRVYTEDPIDRPDDLADSLLDPPDFHTGQQVMRAGKNMFVEELTNNPRMRQYMRRAFYTSGVIDCERTDKGLVEITEDHRYYEFKYLRGLEFTIVAGKPELFLKMLKAEEEGLVTIKFRILNKKFFREKLYGLIESDSVSEVADAWNTVRRGLIDSAIDKLEKITARGVQDALRSECENTLGRQCREKYYSLLDQMPFKPENYEDGETPKVLAISNGKGVLGRDAVCWVFVDEHGKVVDHGKFNDIRSQPEDKKHLPQGADNGKLLKLIEDRAPDVIGVSGFSVETRRLFKDVEEIVDAKARDEKEKRMEQGRPAEGTEDDPLEFEVPPIIMVEDATARLFHTSDRAIAEFPRLAPNVRYCVGIARYLQGPLTEYAALGRDVTSIAFDPNQDLLSRDKLIKHLDTAMIDIVNLSGVNLEDAINNPLLQNLLPYVCGLGPRKAVRLLETINHNGGVVNSRSELVGDTERNILQAVGPVVWNNCASFLYLPNQEDNPESDFLDNTRIHPEDYEIARKISADALGIDEEDIQDEIATGGPSAVVQRLVNSENPDKELYALLMNKYAENLYIKLGQRKRRTLENIREEILEPYIELRRDFVFTNPDDTFTMLTGETKDTLAEGMIIPVKIRRVFADHIEVRLDCGIDGGIGSTEYPRGVGGERGGEDPRQVYSQGQTVQAKLLFLNRKNFTAQLSLREENLKIPYQKQKLLNADWDEDQEASDKRHAQKEKEIKAGRAQRVIKHPLFRPFNSTQAEEFLGSQNPGDLVIRPSSRGIDHLAITWKVSDNVFQHIDVLELDKENEFAVGKVLKIANKYTYSDLDDLIVNHVKAMARKVNEMINDERYQKGSREATEKWLETYTEANPKRSMYAFCINPKYPGYFNLCFKAGRDAKLGSWPVKVVPNAFELQRNPYPDMRALKNGFKVLVSNGRI